MHKGAVTAVAATVVALAAYGLLVTHDRAGPIDATLGAVSLDVAVSGTYQARGDGTVAGVCVLPACEAVTAIDLRFSGLPAAPYKARLDGPGSVSLEELVRDGEDHVLRWSRPEDHTDKMRIVLVLAGRDVATLAVQPSDGPAAVDTTLPSSWRAMPTSVHLNEIGGVTVSTVASARVPEAPPAGWEFHAYFEGRDGTVLLGPLEATPEGAVLDGRVERVGIEDQDRLVVALRPADTDGALGFPVWSADL